MTKEQLINEFRERFTARKPAIKYEHDNQSSTLFVELRGSSVDTLEAFLLYAFDAGRASGIEEVRNIVPDQQAHRERGFVLAQTTEKEEGWNECVEEMHSRLDSLTPLLQ